MPKLTLEVAFRSNPLDASPSYDDLSSRLTASEGGIIGTVQRAKGRAGLLNVVLDNSDAALNPWNTASPYYGNLLSANQADMETDTSGWSMLQGGTFVKATNAGFAANGSGFLDITSNGAAADARAGTTQGAGAVPVVASTTYTFMAAVRAFTTSRTVEVVPVWWNSSGTFISYGTTISDTDSAANWVNLSGQSTSPSNAAYASLEVRFVSAPNGEHHYIDTAMIAGGTVATWTAGGLGGLIQPMKKIRLSAQWNLLTENQGSLETDATGWTAVTNCAVARSTTVGGNDGSAALRLTSSASGDMSASTTQGTGGVPVTAGQTYSAVASFRSAVSVRTVLVQIQWYTSAGAAITTSPGSNVLDGSGGGWIQSTVSAEAPSNAAYAAVFATVRSTGAASEIHYVDTIGLFPSTVDRAVTTWSRGGPYYLFTGYVEEWAAEWENIKFGDTAVRAVTAEKILTLVKPAKTDYRDAVLADTPNVYYRLSENAQSTTSSGVLVAEDDSGNDYDGNYFGAVSVGHPGALPTEVSNAAEFNRGTVTNGGGWVETFISALASGTGNFSIEAWVFPRSFDPAGLDRIWRLLSVGSQNVQLSVRSDGTLRAGFSDGTNGGTLDTSAALTLNRWNHVVAVKSGTTGPANWKIYINKVEVSTGASPAGTGNVTVTANSGQIGGYDVSGVGQGAFDGFIDEVAVYPSALSSARVTAHYDAGYALVANALTGARFGKLLDVIGWPAADRTLDAGQFQMQPVVDPIYDTPIFGLLERYVESEGWPAAWFMSGAGFVVFQDRAHATPSSSATFADSSSTLYYDAGPGPNRSDKSLWTNVVMQAENGKPQTSRDTTAAGKFIERTLTRTGLLNNSDADVATMTAAELARGKTPRDRIDRLVLHPIDEPGPMWPHALGRDLNDRISVERYDIPGGGNDFIFDCRIEEIGHSFGAQDWFTTFALEPT